MAKEKMVTREVVTTAFTVTGMSKETGEVEVIEGRVPGEYTYDDEAKLFKYISKSLEYKSFVPVKIEGIAYYKTLYGMSLKLFIDMAQILPPRMKSENKED